MNTDLIPSVLALALVAVPVMSQPVSMVKTTGVKASLSRLVCGETTTSTSVTIELGYGPD